jgi:hypothetical protein
MINVRYQKDFLVASAATFAAVLGIPSVILSLIGATFSVALAVSLVTAAVLLSIVVNRHRLTPPHLPVDQVIPQGFDQRGAKLLGFPREFSTIKQVGFLAHEFYGAATISVDRYEQLRMENRCILVCLTGKNGELLGYFDVIPLRASFAEMFLRGTATEKEVTHQDVLGRNAMKSCTHLYVSGLAASHPETHAGKENACILVWGLLKYLHHFYGNAKPLAFASAVTREGEELLKRFGFGLVSAANGRADAHAMYSMMLTHAEVERRLACVPDYHDLCALEWISTGTIHTSSRTRMPRRGIAASGKLRLLTFPERPVERAG